MARVKSETTLITKAVKTPSPRHAELIVAYKELVKAYSKSKCMIVEATTLFDKYPPAEYGRKHRSVMRAENLIMASRDAVTNAHLQFRAEAKRIGGPLTQISNTANAYTVTMPTIGKSRTHRPETVILKA